MEEVFSQKKKQANKKLSESILYCTVLYCTVLCCAVLCCAVLCCAVLCYTVLYCTVLYCTGLYNDPRMFLKNVIFPDTKDKVGRGSASYFSLFSKSPFPKVPQPRHQRSSLTGA
ncbi:hypothetical protein PoB_003176100 [Plakobranchus ocellatus]|uniref:Uncharacterized protein n=1 Tax=Plakobranchus ocellatus TaxID=259542 RepID=A0AAV4AA98_9GAST|nr:hypothetical protein PoB_003176100 [Plakobranchus ocellatus]